MSAAISHNNKLPHNLPMLQNLIKRDPTLYFEEFERQYQMFKGMKEVFELQPAEFTKEFSELVTFIAQVSLCYEEKLSTFPDDIISILHRHGPILNPATRMALVKALILMKNKGLIPTRDLLELFFKLLRSQDKGLRKFLQTGIITDVVNNNVNKKNIKLNKDLQNFMSDMLKNNHAVAIKTSLDIMVALYKKNIWNDAKTVNIIVDACYSKIVKVMVAAIKFFVGIDLDGDESDSDSDGEERKTVSKAKHTLKVNVASKSRESHLKKSRKTAKKKHKNKDNDKKSAFDFSAIHLIHDPQKLAENLYKKLEKLNERFEVKLMIMNFLSRLIGIHELYLPNFYAYLQRYLFVQQRDVTKIMVFLAQAAHPLVPPEDLESVVRTLADNFVTDRYRGEVMAMGINAIRELCARNHFCMNEDLLLDLCQFRGHKDKGVSLAAASLMCLFREINPSILAKRYRGAPTELSVESGTKLFGKNDAKAYIPGAELLYFTTNENADDSNGMSYSDDSDEEEDGQFTNKAAREAVMQLTPEERAQKAMEIVCSRPLTDEDFAAIKKLQNSKKRERFSKSRKKTKRPLEEEEEERGEYVTLKSIEMVHKKRKHDKEARMATTIAGRVDQPKYGSRKGRFDPHASTTNREKKKTKHFMMVKHKFNAAMTRKSFKDRLATLRSRLRKKMK